MKKIVCILLSSMIICLFSDPLMAMVRNMEDTFLEEAFVESIALEKLCIEREDQEELVKKLLENTSTIPKIQKCKIAVQAIVNALKSQENRLNVIDKYLQWVLDRWETAKQKIGAYSKEYLDGLYENAEAELIFEKNHIKKLLLKFEQTYPESEITLVEGISSFFKQALTNLKTIVKHIDYTSGQLGHFALPQPDKERMHFDYQASANNLINLLIIPNAQQFSFHELCVHLKKLPGFHGVPADIVETILTLRATIALDGKDFATLKQMKEELCKQKWWCPACTILFEMPPAKMSEPIFDVTPWFVQS